MEQVKEDYEIAIREINTAQEVKDIEFILNTSQSGNASFITPHINGELDGIIISCMEPISVKITFDESENIVLFDMVSYSGDAYLPLRVGGLANTGENFENSPEKWALNNKLKISISGGYNKDISFCVRYK